MRATVAQAHAGYQRPAARWETGRGAQENAYTRALAGAAARIAAPAELVLDGR